MTDEDKLHPEKTVAKRLYVKPSALQNWRWQGKGPTYVKIGRNIFYRESALRAWLKSLERDPAAKGRA